MSLAINIIGTKVLREKSQEITSDFEGLKDLIKEMFETMQTSNGIGLAAPQVGKSIRLFVVDTSPLAEDEKNETKKKELLSFKKTFINPVITERFGNLVDMEEGCLSIPDIYENVSREEGIKIEYYDENFQFQTLELHGISSRVVQHEYDHLEGILFTDKIAIIRRKLLKNKLISISRGKFRKNYKVKLGVK
jgi:peptide deformylase